MMLFQSRAGGLTRSAGAWKQKSEASFLLLRLGRASPLPCGISDDVFSVKFTMQIVKAYTTVFSDSRWKRRMNHRGVDVRLRLVLSAAVSVRSYLAGFTTSSLQGGGSMVALVVSLNATAKKAR